MMSRQQLRDLGWAVDQAAQTVPIIAPGNMSRRERHAKRYEGARRALEHVRQAYAAEREGMKTVNGAAARKEFERTHP